MTNFRFWMKLLFNFFNLNVALTPKG